MAVFLRKLLRIGGLPDELRTKVDAEGLIYLAEYVPVTRRFSGSVPGKRVEHRHRELCRFAGDFLAACAGHPVVGAQARGPHYRPGWNAPQSGPVTADISSTGLHIEVDVGQVDQKFDGHLSLNYKTDIGEDVLMRLPRRSLAFEVPPEYVLRMVGVPARG